MMRPIIHFGFFSVLVLTTIGTHGQAADRMPGFQQLMSEAGIVFRSPDGFEPVTPRANDLLACEHAVRHVSGELEIRYAIRPLARIAIDYSDPHSAAPEPEHLYPLLFDSLTNRLAGGRHSVRREYPAAEARRRFNADWAAASVFDVEADYAGRYREALLLALHRRGQADAYAVFLYNDANAAKPLINAALPAFAFTP